MKPTVPELISQLNGLAIAAGTAKDDAAVATLTAAAERLSMQSGTNLAAGDWFWAADSEYGGGTIREALEHATDEEPGVYVEQISRSLSLPSVWVAASLPEDGRPEIHVFATKEEAAAKADELRGGRQEGLDL